MTYWLRFAIFCDLRFRSRPRVYVPRNSLVLILNDLLASFCNSSSRFTATALLGLAGSDPITANPFVVFRFGLAAPRNWRERIAPCRPCEENGLVACGSSGARTGTPRL